MRTRIILLISAIAAFAASGCKENVTPAAAKLVVRESVLSFESAASDKTIKFTATRDWTATVASGASEWLSISETSGGASDSEKTLTVSVFENTGKDRTGTITFEIKSGSLTLDSKTVTVNQAGKQGSSYITIENLRKLAPSNPSGSADIPEGTMIKGHVISNTAINSLNSKKVLYVQDETAGIQLFLSANSTFAFGDEVSVDLTGQKLTFYAGALQINGVPIDKVAKQSNSAVEAKEVPLADFLGNKYEGQYVAVKTVQIASADLSKTFVMGGKATSISVQASTGEKFEIRSSQYASFGAETVPQGAGTIKGIASTYNGTIQLIFAQNTDWAGLTGERFKLEGEPKTIAEVVSGNVSGLVKVKGNVVAISGSSFVINDGGDHNLYVYTGPDDADKGTKSPGSWGMTATDMAVEVEASAVTYGANSKFHQLTDVTAVNKLSETITPKKLPAKVLTSAEIDAYDGASSEFVTVEGKVEISGNYVNVTFGGTTFGSLVACELTDGMKTGDILKITGYYAGRSHSSSTGKYFFNLLPVSSEAGTLPVFEVGTTAIEVVGSATSATIEVLGNVAWTAVSDNSKFTLNPASGNAEGSITVSFPANTDPVNEVVCNVTVSTEAAVPVKSYVVKISQKAAVAATAKYVRVAAAPGDWSGKYLMVVEDGINKVFSGFSTTSTVYGTGMDITVSGTDIEYSAGAAYEIEIAKAAVTSGAYVIKFKEKFLNWAAGNSLDGAAAETANANWTIEYNAKGIVIKNAAESARQIWWNASYSRFACYTGKTFESAGYKAPRLFKYTE